MTKVDTVGGGLEYSYPLLGGGGVDIAYGVAVDAAGNAHVVGATRPPTSRDRQCVPGRPRRRQRRLRDQAESRRLGPRPTARLPGRQWRPSRRAVAVDGAGKRLRDRRHHCPRRPPSRRPSGVFQSAGGGNVDAFVAKIAVVKASPTISTQASRRAVRSACRSTTSPPSPAAHRPDRHGDLPPVQRRRLHRPRCSRPTNAGSGGDGHVRRAFTADGGRHLLLDRRLQRRRQQQRGDVGLQRTRTSRSRSPPFQAPRAHPHDHRRPRSGPLTVTAGESVLITGARVVGPGHRQPRRGADRRELPDHRRHRRRPPRRSFSICGTDVDGAVAGARRSSVTNAARARSASATRPPAAPATASPARSMLTGNLAVTFGANTVSHNATIDTNGARARPWSRPTPSSAPWPAPATTPPPPTPASPTPPAPRPASAPPW